MSPKINQAYTVGYSDGLNWDLDGFETIEEVMENPEGWSTATIQALGHARFCEEVGLPVDASDEDFEQVCADYEEGCVAGALSPQDKRTGLPPKEAL